MTTSTASTTSTLIRTLIDSSAELVRLADPGPYDQAELWTARARFTGLHRAANRLAGLPSLDPPLSPETTKAVQDLEHAYDLAVRYFETIHGLQPGDAAIQRTRGAMRSLVNYIYARPLNYWEKPQSGVDSLASYAAALTELADRLDNRVGAELSAGRVQKDAAAPLEQSAAAVRAFADRIVATHGNPDALDEDYIALIDRLDATFAVLPQFTKNTQGAFGEIWHVAQQLNFLAPQVAIGRSD